MKGYLAFAAAALVATPAVAAPVVSFSATPAAFPIKAVDLTFTVLRPGIIDGTVSEFKSLKLRKSVASVSNSGGKFDFVSTFLSRPLSTLSLAPVHIAAGTYTFHYQDLNADGFSGSVNFTSTPEPGTWALMILGFGAVGFAMRRGRRQPGEASYA